MELIRDPAAMTAWSEAHRVQGQRIGFVPTMGFLHRGHTSLMERLRPRVDKLVVSIYVNPLQFGPTEDLDVYPRDLAGDMAQCEAVGVDAVFAPADLYPDGFRTSVEVFGLTEGLCGAKRPGHFQGVTTVVARLFGLVRCHEACFGEKDWQQLVVLHQMTRDLALPVQIVPGPLVRDHDGLALSSRNTYLSAEQRQRGLSLHTALFAMAEAVDQGRTSAAELLELGRSMIQADRLDYLEIVGALDLEPLEVVDRPARALVAGFFGNTRLIDNVALGGEPSWS